MPALTPGLEPVYSAPPPSYPPLRSCKVDPETDISHLLMQKYVSMIQTSELEYGTVYDYDQFKNWLCEFP